jgi:hypothetical protein
MKRFYLLIVMIIMMMGVVGLSARPRAEALSSGMADFDISCTGITYLGGSVITADRDNTGDGRERFYLEVVDGKGTPLYRTHPPYSIPIGDSIFLPSYVTFGWWGWPEYNPISVRLVSYAGNGYDEQIILLDTGMCPGLPTAGAVEVAAPGCDMLVEIPDQAVGGQFVDNAAIYWAPGEMINPPMVIEVGKTYLVAGQDATGLYRKVLLSCDWVWVEAGKVGPNPQTPWNNAPLPTTVVS